ncbi:hypothetical protein P4O66_012254 [Electrophorus voltai]|uniref:MALT paracaspase 1 n=1 Tax=Electrophorus voltai TaxID=2609070 RepID=A0AAD8Z4H8_9TELE|nr:hypothetical protein P4O66_012254 [Electrophorus voltai]
MTTVSQDSYDNSRNINFLKESVFKRLCECLDKANNKGWRKLGETVNSERRFKVSLGDIEMCSLKVLEVEGSPSRSLLRLMGDRGCTLGDLAEFLRMMGHTEALQCLKPGIEILIQPQSVAVIAGHSIRLSCYAAGMSPVQYQWFKGKEEARLMSLPSEGRLRVVTQPKPQSLLVGDALYLECGAVGRPLPHYQWYRNGVPLKNATKRKFSISYLMLEHHGRYRCEISCNSEKTWSNEVDVLVDDFIAIGQSNSLEKPYATDKVALLIGNMSYQNHPQLKAPMVDVYDLTNLLRQLNFKVVSLLDLTESEMRNAVEEFLSLLHKGVYGLLYYAGHGYENFGNSFMVPVDAPNPYRSANCLCVQSILKLMQEKETGLNVFLLDMCRKRNFHDKDMPNVMLKVTANIVFGYATCQDAEAFELSSSGLTNGVFITFLKGRLLEDEKITVLLDRVAEGMEIFLYTSYMGQFDPTKGKQALEIRSSLSERRSLTDPILPGDCSDVAQAHSLLWTKAHELPESMTLNFECGVQIKMGFAAEFSNVLIIYTSIVKKPEEMSSCQAHLINLSDLDPKMMNKQTPEETGSYLLSDSLPQHCLYTRLSSLQKLKEKLVFTVCLQAEFTSLEEQVQWTVEVDIGKPLIAKLDLHRPTRRNSCQLTCHMPHSPCTSPTPSPGAEHMLLHQMPFLHPQSCSPHLHVYEPLYGAAGGFGNTQTHGHYEYHYENIPCSPYLPLPSVPIETTDDVEDMQNKLMDSLHFFSQP